MSTRQHELTAWYYVGMDFRHVTRKVVLGSFTQGPEGFVNVLYEDGHAGVEKHANDHEWDDSSWGPKYDVFWWCQ